LPYDWVDGGPGEGIEKVNCRDKAECGAVILIVASFGLAALILFIGNV